MSRPMPKPNTQTYVIVYEQFFDDAIPLDAIRETLEKLREYGGARIINSYSFPGSPHDPENREWLDKAITALTLPIEID